MTVVSNPASFRAEARWQRVCVYCGKARPFHAHHAVDKAELKKWGVPEQNWYDTRLAMRLCCVVDNHCHFQFENRRIRIPLKKLPDAAIEAAFEYGGTRAYYYLHREYDGDDPRVELKLDAILEQCA